MKTAVAMSTEPLELRQVRDESCSTTSRRVRDYVELTKPRIAVLVLFTVAAGFCLAGGSTDYLLLFHVVFGTACVAAGASVLNQLLERHTDALMRRTAHRPLPAGRLQPWEVLLWGMSLGVGGLLYLGLFVKQPLCVTVAAFTFLTYVAVYTPLKRITTLNTLVGAVPGALPPIIGWTAVRGTLPLEAAVVFLIVFLWQVPHFLAIAWLYRHDYAQAGLRMLPVIDEHGTLTGRQMVVYCVALLAISVVPVTIGVVSWWYLLGVLLLGGMFLWTTWKFARDASMTNARLVLRASLIYLPLVLLLLVVCVAINR